MGRIQWTKIQWAVQIHSQNEGDPKFNETEGESSVSQQSTFTGKDFLVILHWIFPPISSGRDQLIVFRL